MPNEDVIAFHCPNCDKRLKARIDLAGRDVKCPKCQHPVAIPGPSEPSRSSGADAEKVQPAEASPSLARVPVASSDDDWLNLGGPAIADLPARKQAVEENKLGKERERTAKLNKEKQRQRSTPSATPGMLQSAPTVRSATDSNALAKRSVFDDDLPELADLQSTLPPKISADKLLADHSGVDMAELESLAPLIAGRVEVQPKEVEDKDPEYRIECKSCGTAQYVRLSNKGMKIKCPDCFLEFKIPPPPLGWTSKKKPKLQLTGEDIPLSAAEEVHHAQTLESQRMRAAKILESAKQQVTDEDMDRLYDGDFDTAGFVQRTFGFLKDPIAIAHIIGYGVVFAAIFALGQFTSNNIDTRYGPALLLLTAISAPAIAVLFAMPMLSGAIALLESVANRQKRVADWPGFNLFDNAGDIAAISFALVAALIPGFLVGWWLGGEGAGAGRIQIAGMMATSFALFPVFLLSILDNGSIFAPLSSSIFRSFSEAMEAWGAYYLKTLIAFSTIMVMWLMLLGKGEGWAALAGCLLPLLVFFTCQQIGALADAISEHLSFEWEPPNKDSSNDTEGDSIGSKEASGRSQQAIQR